MKKSLYFLAFIVGFFSLSSFIEKDSYSKARNAKSPAIIFNGYKTVGSANGNPVTVYVEWNPSLPAGSQVDQVTVIDVWGVITYTVTMWEQYPRMNLVSGVLVASGWRCNFNPGSDYVVLNGNLTMY